MTKQLTALIGLAELEIDALLAEPHYAPLRRLPREKLIERIQDANRDNPGGTVQFA